MRSSAKSGSMAPTVPPDRRSGLERWCSRTGRYPAAMPDNPDVVSVERIIPALAERIFPLLADPARHREIDGSGTVRDVKPGSAPSEPLKLGSKFGMKMKMGLPYSMESTVIEFEENRRIAWQTRPPGIFANLGGGRIWRYELEPADGGSDARSDRRRSRGRTRHRVEKADRPEDWAASSTGVLTASDVVPTPPFA